MNMIEFEELIDMLASLPTRVNRCWDKLNEYDRAVLTSTIEDLDALVRDMSNN